MAGEVTYRYEDGESLFELTLPSWKTASPDPEVVPAAPPHETTPAVFAES